MVQGFIIWAQPSGHRGPPEVVIEMMVSRSPLGGGWVKVNAFTRERLIIYIMHSLLYMGFLVKSPQPSVGHGPSIYDSNIVMILYD